MGITRASGVEHLKCAFMVGLIRPNAFDETEIIGVPG